MLVEHDNFFCSADAKQEAMLIVLVDYEKVLMIPITHCRDDGSHSASNLKRFDVGGQLRLFCGPFGYSDEMADGLNRGSVEQGQQPSQFCVHALDEIVGLSTMAIETDWSIMEIVLPIGLRCPVSKVLNGLGAIGKV